MPIVFLGYMSGILVRAGVEFINNGNTFFGIALLVLSLAIYFKGLRLEGK